MSFAPTLQILPNDPDTQIPERQNVSELLCFMWLLCSFEGNVWNATTANNESTILMW